MNKGVRHWQSTSIYYSTTHECILTLALLRQIVNMCMCVHACTHMHTDEHKGWKYTGVKLLQMLILWVRKIMNLNSGDLPLGDTNVFRLSLCFSYRCCCLRKRLAAGGESACSLLTAVAIK